MRHALPVLVVLLVVGAGCVTTGDPAATPTEPTSTDPTPTPTDTADPTPTSSLELASSGVACHEDLWVSFWGLGYDAENFWDQDLARVGYYVPANTSFLVVTYVDGAIEGVAAENNTYDDGVNVDGAELHLDSTFSAEHTVEVVLYGDENGNGKLDDGADGPCHVDGEVVSAGPEVVDFGRFD